MTLTFDDVDHHTFFSGTHRNSQFCRRRIHRLSDGPEYEEQ